MEVAVPIPMIQPGNETRVCGEQMSVAHWPVIMTMRVHLPLVHLIGCTPCLPCIHTVMLHNCGMNH